jgi:hypothetical protein
LATETRLAAIVFYRTPTLDSRMTLTTELLHSWFPKPPGSHGHPLLKEWLSLRARMTDLIPYRNLMAHHPIDMTGEKDYEFKHLSDGNIELIPVDIKSHFKVETSKSEIRRGRIHTIKSLKDAEMPSHYKTILELHKDIRSFRTSLQKEMLTRLHGQIDLDHPDQDL